MELITKAVIKCPYCGHEQQEMMPQNSCQYFYQCKNCHRILKTTTGHCCVFCSYGSSRCPSCQKGESRCA